MFGDRPDTSSVGGLMLRKIIKRCAERLGYSTRCQRWLTPEDQESAKFRAFVERNIDKADYLSRNPDVAKACADPVEHWLNHGCLEGRRLSPDLEVLLGQTAALADQKTWELFRYRGKFVAVRPTFLPQRVVDQILEQGQFDAAVFAPGFHAIRTLRRYNFADLLSRHGIDITRLLGVISQRPRAVILLPFLVIGGVEKYASAIVEAFEAAGLWPTLVLVTDQTEAAAAKWQPLSILAPLRKAQIVFWRSFCPSVGRHEAALARILNGIAPDVILVINSQVGLEMVSRYGRGLSQKSKLFCAFFGLSPNALGAPYGWRYPRSTLPFATALTDNGRTARILRNSFAALPQCRIAILPPMSELATREEWDERLFARRLRAASVQPCKRWLWISRIEYFKGLKLLNEVATLRSGDEFHIFGPADRPLEELGLRSDNIKHNGFLNNVGTIDCALYDAFIFTSMFEGMPNVVLEMAQKAIPLVLTRVGGLDETFDDSAAIFIEPDKQSSSRSFADALAGLTMKSPDDIVSMVNAAYEQASSRHGPETFRRNVARLFCTHEPNA
ncbi:hypothetical protein CCS01_30155 [Rhodopila globiformis]|uniref:Glycosyl transferase family 1 domain-containing protein n=2 Tax=Rhodopila globiformis TaxID=1071 RepID=A0A2S6MVB4_RHOGL|nr:hypothetical protein CCS01_30155 [Rhodopila globiformis]